MRIGGLRIAFASFALVLASCAAAFGSGSSISLVGPHVNAFHTSFHFLASGATSGAANHVWAWETPATRPCATSYSQEIRRGRIFLFVTKPLERNHSFSFVIRFYARNRESHHLCAYLVNQRTGTTFAHAEASWRNE